MEQHTVLCPNLLFAKLHKLLPINDQLKDIGIQQSLQSPRIIVGGNYGHGKSSVLESIIGLDFLPKGEGAVTLRPIEINLIHLSSDEVADLQLYAEFPQEGNEKYHDFQQVQDKIFELMNKVAKVMDDPIIINIYSPDYPNLTLVDLPPILRVPYGFSGRPDLDLTNIEKITKDLTRRYMHDPNTIILCVMLASQGSECAECCHAYFMSVSEDPWRRRTIGILSKIDLMDRGTSAQRMLLDQEIPLTLSYEAGLKLGWIGVKGRSQQDLLNGMKVAEGIKAESEFFASHPVYPHLPPGLVGTEALLQKLSEALFTYMRRGVPEICTEIQAKTTQCEEKLNDLDIHLAEKESLNKTLQVLKNLKSTLNNDPDFALNTDDDFFFEKFEKSQKDELEKTKLKSGDSIGKEPESLEQKTDHTFAPKRGDVSLFGPLEHKNENSLAPKGKGASLFGSQKQQNKNPFAPKWTLFG